MNRCQHLFWDKNIARNTRWCKQCPQRQYNYTGKWENAFTLEQFVEKWVPLRGASFHEDIVIKACMLFEFNCYESWGVAFKVVFPEGREFGPFSNFNQADFRIREKLNENN